LPLATAVISGIVLPQAQKSASFAEGVSKKEPSFKACQDAFVNIGKSLQSAVGELKASLETANYDVMVCTDQTTKVADLIGKNQDADSKTLMGMTMQMNKLIRLGVAATQVLGG
ncbi:hypothetical protein CARUB_v10028604mg, partial [Capsella rubella]